jgi:hypothetical protein
LGLGISFFRGLYNVRRGYNIDNGKDDPKTANDNRCFGSSVNSMVNSLNGSHSLVEMVKVTDPTVRENICGLINEYLSDRNKREMFDPAIINLNLMLWQQNNDMPVELKEQINSCFKDLILDKIIGDLGSYLGGNRQAQLAKLEPLFEQALNEVRISKKLQQELQKFDLSQIPGYTLRSATINYRGLF